MPVPRFLRSFFSEKGVIAPVVIIVLVLAALIAATLIGSRVIKTNESNSPDGGAKQIKLDTFRAPLDRGKTSVKFNVEYKPEALGVSSTQTRVASACDPARSIQALERTETSIRISWSASTPPQGWRGYKVRRTGGTQPALYHEITTGNPQYNDTGLTPSTTYTYEVVVWCDTDSAPATASFTTSGSGGSANQPGTYTLNGAVVNDKNRNGNLDSGDEAFVGGARIALNTGQTTTSSTFDGNYSFNGLAAGTYTASITVPQGYQATGPIRQSVTIPPVPAIGVRFFIALPAGPGAAPSASGSISPPGGPGPSVAPSAAPVPGNAELTPEASTGLPKLPIPCHYMSSVCRYLIDKGGRLALTVELTYDAEKLTFKFACGAGNSACREGEAIGTSSPVPCDESDEMKKYCDYVRRVGSPLPSPSPSGSVSPSPSVTARPSGSAG